MTDFDGENTYRILESIAYPRLPGTDGERTAAKTLAGHLRATGIEAGLEPYRIWTYINDTASLEVLEPYQKTYEAAVLGLSGSTSSGGLECGFKYVEDGSSQYLADVAGAAVLLTRGGRYGKLRELIEKGVVALLRTGNPHRLHSRGVFREPESMLAGKLPAANLRFEDALELVKKGASRIRLRIEQEAVEGVSNNVVAEIPGTEHPDEVIVCVAHYDTVSGSVGGHDNGAGTAIIVEAARCLAATPLKRTVRIVLCGGEEFGLHGSRDYVEKHADELDNFRLCVNCDVAGVIFGRNAGIVTGPDSLRWYVEGMGHEYGMNMTVNTNVYSSDNIPFTNEGIPAASFARSGGLGFDGHTIRDGIEDIDAEHLALTGRFVLEFLRRVGNAIEFPFEREIPGEQKKKLENYLERIHGTHYKPLKKLKKK